MNLDIQQYNQQFEQKYFYLPKICRKKDHYNKKLSNNLIVRKYNNYYLLAL